MHWFVCVSDGVIYHYGLGSRQATLRGGKLDDPSIKKRGG